MTPTPAVPAGLVASVRAAQTPMVLLIRHSDRPHIAPGDSGVSVRLTDTGRSRVASLRAALDGELRWAVSSPLVRCTETARCLGVEPETSSLLGAPGAFVTDTTRGGEVFGRHGTETVVRQQLTGETWGCMRPLAEGAGAVFDWLARLRETRGGLGVAVSHDAIVMPTIAWTVGETFEGEWLAPLDGLVIDAAGVVWRGRRYEGPR